MGFWDRMQQNIDSLKGKGVAPETIDAMTPAELVETDTFQVRVDLAQSAWAEGGVLGRIERAVQLVGVLGAAAAPRLGRDLAERLGALLLLTLDDAKDQIQRDDQFVRDAVDGEALPGDWEGMSDRRWREQTRTQMPPEDLLQADLRELLALLGMGDHARAASPHAVFQEALGVLRGRLAGDTGRAA